MTVDFIGTGAADWGMPGGGDFRRRSCIAINRALMADFGTGSFAALEAAGLKSGAVMAIFVSHSHCDHFSREDILSLAEAKEGTLCVCASKEVLSLIPDGAVGKLEMAPGSSVPVPGGKAYVLEGNHFSSDGETTLHYLFDIGGKSLLYALDGAWLTGAERQGIMRALHPGRRLDAIVWDAMRGLSEKDGRFADHNNLQMIRAMIGAMRETGLAGDGTMHFFSHISKALWPFGEEERESIAASFGGILAKDGMSANL